MSRDTAAWAQGGGPRRQNALRHAWADVRKLWKHRGWQGPSNVPKALHGRAVAAHATAPISWRGRFHADASGIGDHLLGRGPLVIVANMADEEDPARVLSALPAERRRHTVIVLRRPTMQQLVRLPVAEVSMDRPRIGGGRLVRWLQRGGTVVVFPEAAPSTDGELGGFHPFAAELAARAKVRIAPAAVQGSFAGDRITVRFGNPISVDPYDTAASRSRAAVASLLAENSTSWWAELTSDDEGRTERDDRATWRRIWNNSAPTHEDPALGGIWS